jgi:hypothetical protein
MRIEGVPDRDSIRPGMAFYAGTGPLGKTFGSCEHLDCMGGKKPRCAMFRKLAGRRGETVDKRNAACKYFKATPKPPPIVPRNKPQE